MTLLLRVTIACAVVATLLACAMTPAPTSAVDVLHAAGAADRLSAARVRRSTRRLYAAVGVGAGVNGAAAAADARGGSADASDADADADATTDADADADAGIFALPKFEAVFNTGKATWAELVMAVAADFNANPYQKLTVANAVGPSQLYVAQPQQGVTYELFPAAAPKPTAMSMLAAAPVTISPQQQLRQVVWGLLKGQTFTRANAPDKTARDSNCKQQQPAAAAASAASGGAVKAGAAAAGSAGAKKPRAKPGTASQWEAVSRQWTQVLGYPGDQAGHIVPQALGGSVFVSNIWPQSPNSNVAKGVDGWTAAEALVLEYHKRCPAVSGRIVFEYADKVRPFRPTHGWYRVQGYFSVNDAAQEAAQLTAAKALKCGPHVFTFLNTPALSPSAFWRSPAYATFSEYALATEADSRKFSVAYTRGKMVEELIKIEPSDPTYDQIECDE